MIPFLMMMAVFIGMMFAVVFGLTALVNRFNGWNNAYESLGKRYAGKVGRGFLFSRPTLAFDYGRTFCRVKNIRGRRNIENKTQMKMTWPVDASLALAVSSEGAVPTSGGWFNRKLTGFDLEPHENGVKLTAASNKPEVAKSLLTPGVRWQIRQLQNHTDQKGVSFRIDRGAIFIEKPGYIKKQSELDDFVRYGLEMFDQMMLTKSDGVDFVQSEETQVVEDVKCPICSQHVVRDMVVCVRCKSPHCGDCWEYNGGCATFACNESRFIRTSQTQAKS